jgi:asparagine synthase (glutamine-hydrolysing)
MRLARDRSGYHAPSREDDAGECWSADGRVGLERRLLANTNLSLAGHQPMKCEVGELCTVFKGATHNFTDLRGELASKGHTFRPQSDTEVILAAYFEWDTDCLLRLKGVFALALSDGRQGRPIMVRGRVGEDSLYYVLIHGSIYFAFELKGLMAAPVLNDRRD